MTRIQRGRPEFDVDLRFGEAAEAYIEDVRSGFFAGKVEVKHDSRYSTTGNLYVEYECFRGGRWQRSGIATTEAHVWAFVLYGSNLILAAPTDLLKEICRRQLKAGRVAQETDGSHPTKGVLLPASTLLAWVRDKAKETA